MSRFQQLLPAKLNMTDQTPTNVQFDPRGSRGLSNIRLHAKSYPKVVGIILALTPAILLFGYDAVAVSSIVALPSFRWVNLNIWAKQNG